MHFYFVQSKVGPPYSSGLWQSFPWAILWIGFILQNKHVCCRTTHIAEVNRDFFSLNTETCSFTGIFCERNCLPVLVLQGGPPHQMSNKNKQITKASWGLMSDKWMSLEQPSADRQTLHLCSFPAVYEVINTKMVGQTLYRWIIVHSVVVRVQRGD